VRLVDTNLLVYARSAELPQHKLARQWFFDEKLNGRGRIGLPWTSLLGFLRIVTSLRILQRPENIRDALDQVEAWRSCPNVWIPQPTEQHAAILGRILEQLGSGGKLVPYAHLAALAIEHGLTLCSTDGDFARFAELRWENPLAPRKR
jgi:toxin-antitoxin system PIN domain toxin